MLIKLDQFVERTSRILRLQSAERRDIASLQNWVKATGCLAREETAYLAYRSDLASLAPVGDGAILQLETWVEDKLIQYWQGFRNVKNLTEGRSLDTYWLTSIEPISRPLHQSERVHLPGSPSSAFCKGNTNFSDHASSDDASHYMQPDQHHLSPDRHHYTVHHLIPPYSLPVNKVEDDGVDTRRGYVSAELLEAISTANRPIQICYYSRCVCLWNHYDTKLEASSRDIYRF